VVSSGIARSDADIWLPARFAKHPCVVRMVGRRSAQWAALLANDILGT
jgi:hypothetical protein